jgi:hypothetical protein
MLDTLEHVLPTDKPLFTAYSLQSVEPVLVVGISQIGITRLLRLTDLLTQTLRPLGAGEVPDLHQRNRHGKGLRFPRFAEHGTLFVAWQRRQIIITHSQNPRSGRFQVVFPQIHVDSTSSVGVLAPQLGCFESNSVEMPALPRSFRIAVGKDMGTFMGVDHP